MCAQVEPRLVIVCGLPGSGKTTLARRLAEASLGVRLCPDEWLAKLGFDVWDGRARERVESLQWEVATAVLRAGGTAIIEWGTWARSERDRLREQARALSARVELHVLDPPLPELCQRVRQRQAEEPSITVEDLVEWNGRFERPTDDELALYDPPTKTP